MQLKVGFGQPEFAGLRDPETVAHKTLAAGSLLVDYVGDFPAVGASEHWVHHGVGGGLPLDTTRRGLIRRRTDSLANSNRDTDESHIVAELATLSSVGRSLGD